MTMTPYARQVIREMAERHQLSPHLIVEKNLRLPRVVAARLQVARLLSLRGYSTGRIGAILNKDHTTIVFYLGRGKKRPSQRLLAAMQ